MAERRVTADGANCLRLDHATLEVVRAFAAEGVPSVLLKGPVITEWLYGGDRDRRAYNDIDLLVPPERTEAARQVLRRLGFTCDIPLERALPHGRPRHAEAWFRPRDCVAVDLHRSIHGAERVPPAQQWRAARSGATPIDLLGEDVDAPGPAFRTLHAVLHLRPRDAPGTRAWEDLTVALDDVPEPTWRAAADLASRLGVDDTMGALLARHPHGAATAAHLGLPCTAPLWMRLEYDGRTDAARFVAEVLEAPRLEALLLLKDKVLPPAGYRAAHPSAGGRRGRAIRRLAPLLHPRRLLHGLAAPWRAGSSGPVDHAR